MNILWRTDPQEPLKSIELYTVTYGTNCAPFLATRVLKDLADRHSDLFPLASEALIYQTYMDDILTGCDSLKDLNLLYSQLNDLLTSAGSNLHKWSTNAPVPVSPIVCNPAQPQHITQENCANKILGLQWTPLEDFFIISVPKTKIPANPTKRILISTVAQIFDPLP